MKRAFVMLALLLAGCDQPTQSRMDAAFPTYRGEPIERLFARWGRPDDMIVVPENQDRVYIWNVKTSRTFSGTTTTMGTIGATPITMQVPTTETLTAACTIKIATNPQGRIMAMSAKGASAACNDFVSRM
jgi:hypothetical protein